MNILANSLRNDFTQQKINKSLFIKIKGKDFLIIQVYVNDIIFYATNNILYQEFFNLIRMKFEMTMVEQFNFFLGLHIK